MRLGRYKIISRIARGGMAEVFKAESSGGKIIAIKKILPQYTNNEKFLSMFLDEAKIMISLRHPNIVQLYDFGRVGKDYFLAMEWVDGKPLSSIIGQLKKQQLAMPVGLVSYIMLEIFCGLEYAHSRRDSYNRDMGIVHRDISPPNILISKEGEIKIADFGIAKAAGNASLTRPGVLKGKFSYMSPEQTFGEDLDDRSDLFSCGTMFYEMLTLERLFLGETDIETIKNVRSKRVRTPSKTNPFVPKELDKIIGGILQRKLKKRTKKAVLVADALEMAHQKNFPDFDRVTLKGFIQYLYPNMKVFSEKIERQAVVEMWSRRVHAPEAILRKPGAGVAWLWWVGALIASGTVMFLAVYFGWLRSAHVWFSNFFEK